LLLSSAFPWGIIRAGGLTACTAVVTGFAIIASLSLGIFLLPAAILAFVASREALAQLQSRTATKVSLTGIAIGLSLPAGFLLALALLQRSGTPPPSLRREAIPRGASPGLQDAPPTP
jgi:hypothetical protein